MTRIYKTSGELTAPVSNLIAAQAYLRQFDMTTYLDKEMHPGVFHVQWNLTDESHWEVTVITERKLTAEESSALSDWISGQNSDGLGEGFEQQRFAEYIQSDRDRPANLDDGDEDDYVMASFDWRTNPCALELVK